MMFPIDPKTVRQIAKKLGLKKVKTSIWSPFKEPAKPKPV